MQNTEPSISGGSFIWSMPMMEREDFLRIALRYDTTMSDALLRALGAERPAASGKAVDRDAKSRKYRGARKLMAQRHGVRL